MSQQAKEDTMGATLQIGQMLKGKLGSYKLTKQLHHTVWQATNQLGGKVVIKSVNHPRIQRERNILLRFQERTPHIRPLLDEVDPDAPSHALVMEWLDDDLNTRKLAGTQLKFVAKGVLEALQVLHADGYVHTDIKPSNILVHVGPEDQEITEVQVADFGSTMSEENKYAKEGEEIGTAVFNSPELFLSMPWSTPIDIWAFGATIISLIYGRGFTIFDPKVPADHADFCANILSKHYEIFGPFPASYEEIADEWRLNLLAAIMDRTPPEAMSLFSWTTSAEVSDADKAFILRIMKLDPRDRPTATELLEDKWFRTQPEVSSDNTAPQEHGGESLLDAVYG